jgi:hypothetical protein
MVVLGAISPVPAAFELTLQVTVLAGLLVPVTVALNCTLVLVLVEVVEGLTATLVTVGVVLAGGSGGVTTGGFKG